MHRSTGALRSLTTWTLRLGAVSLLGCATTNSAGAPSPHGTVSDLSRVEGNPELCEHRVPEKVCTLHHPELIAGFKKVGDWCAEHGVPESQCHLCHPDLTFEPLPELPPEADLQWLSRAGEDVPSLEAHLPPGKVTIVDFYADWCVPCRKVDLHVYKLLRARKDVALRKLNVVSWETPLAKRYLAQVPALPYLRVYGRDGKQVAEIQGFDLAALDAAIAEGTK